MNRADRLLSDETELERKKEHIRKYDMPAYFKPTNTLQHLLVQCPKDKVEKGNVVDPVYHIVCGDCDATYVGEMEQLLKPHFLEHWRKSSVDSEVPQHIHVDRLEHGIGLDKVKISTVENKKFERRVKEVIYTWLAKPSLSKDSNCYLLPEDQHAEGQGPDTPWSQDCH